MVSIPSGAFNIVNEVIQDLFEKPVTLVFPARREDCPNCKLTTMGYGRSISMYTSGGPIPFERGQPCPWCNGKGYKEIESTEDINARIYRTRGKWRSYDAKMRLPEGSIEIIVRQIDLPKILQAGYLIPRDLNIDDYGEQKFYRAGEAKPSGFPQNHQFYYSLYFTRSSE